ncbi:bifunctional aspartokinase/homoserine dehydrogenase 1 isoform X4 [Solanum tuberosum]|uniref:bifunctional aspartokinase/homoserine dehydrogenase 1 isoform X4 n=1 Tax=Solanum tuberosum TaxID=4113 RepID=UPI0003D28F99|nr:PREDICTED: bifunctional aspartokinase/homoserine dehydrogenase 1 isoform X4 [Solanum tuberosum]
MKNLPVFLMGCGGVGRQLLQHIVSCRSLHAKQGVHLRVVGVCDSKSLVVVADVLIAELDDSFLLEVCRVKSNGSSLQTLANSGLAFVDCSASAETIGVLNQVVDFGCCVVLANKKPLTVPMEDYDKLVSRPRRLRHESTVGAGLPVIASLNRIISSGDPVYRIIGSLSGTLGYVMSEVEYGRPFSQVVNAAKSLGYTEPDPRDDLGGMDVARKALILARLLGRRLNLDNMKIESLYPEEMGPDVMPLEDFLVNGLPLLDQKIEDRIKQASANGNVLRYVCLIDDARCEVGIQEVSKDSALGRLRGSDNVVEIYSRCYEKQPLVIQGAGAGNDTTAAGVLADILDIQDLFP